MVPGARCTHEIRRNHGRRPKHGHRSFPLFHGSPIRFCVCPTSVVPSLFRPPNQLYFLQRPRSNTCAPRFPHDPSANSKMSWARIVAAPRLKISRGGSIDAFIRPIIVRSDALPSIANIYTTEHAALIFIACKLLQRPRCIGVVFATIGPIFRALLSSSDSLPFSPLSLHSPLFLESFSRRERERGNS